jgi:hypothetical protein
MPLCREWYRLGREVGALVPHSGLWIQFVPGGDVLSSYLETASLLTISQSTQQRGWIGLLWSFGIKGCRPAFLMFDST